MLPSSGHVQELMQEVHDLDQEDLKKLIRMIHFMKNEILIGKQPQPAKGLLKYAGMLKDMSDEETELFSTAIQRKSMFGQRNMQP